MAELMREIEAMPEKWPADYLIQTADAAGQPAMQDLRWVWQRVEAYCRERWTPRNVVWLVQGGGVWTPPLSPVRLEMMESWAEDWMPHAVERSPWGDLVLSGDAHRITAIVGENNPLPPVVIEAASGLARYLTTALEVAPSIERMTVTDSGTSLTIDRPVDWIAQAMVNSGAADLLRPYRRVK